MTKNFYESEEYLNIPLVKFHRSISRKYFGNETEIFAFFLNDPKANFGARALHQQNCIEYEISFSVQNTNCTVLHEFSHLLQHKYCDYSKHDLAFCFINNVLTYDNIRQDGIFIRAYDIKDDFGAQNLRWSFKDFEHVIKYLAGLDNIKSVCEEAYLIANFFALTHSEADTWDTPTITREEVVQRLGADFSPLV